MYVSRNECLFVSMRGDNPRALASELSIISLSSIFVMPTSCKKYDARSGCGVSIRMLVLPVEKLGVMSIVLHGTFNKFEEGRGSKTLSQLVNRYIVHVTELMKIRQQRIGECFKMCRGR